MRETSKEIDIKIEQLQSFNKMEKVDMLANVCKAPVYPALTLEPVYTGHSLCIFITQYVQFKYFGLKYQDLGPNQWTTLLNSQLKILVRGFSYSFTFFHWLHRKCTILWYTYIVILIRTYPYCVRRFGPYRPALNVSLSIFVTHTLQRSRHGTIWKFHVMIISSKIIAVHNNIAVIVKVYFKLLMPDLCFFEWLICT